jgi:hypothetical protein
MYPPSPSPKPVPDDSGLEDSDDELPGGSTLSDWLQRLQINPAHPRFFGKSSGVRLLQSAIDLKSEFSGNEMPLEHQFEQISARRPEFWHIRPWEVRDMGPADVSVGNQKFNFPELDLLKTLVENYFVHAHPYNPLLHRPTFEKAVEENLHVTDAGFGSVLLLVCAIGSRFVTDPRVLLEEAWSHSAGWKWFNQVQMVRKSLLAPPRLYDLQIYCLSALFLHGSSSPQACWSMVGIGIRLAQDVGAHRRKVYGSKPTPHDEMWKRAFWLLVVLDRQLSCGLGRPCAIQDEDFDIDLPIECDDEYWMLPDNQAFKQPPGKPSYMSFFNCSIKLNQILAFAMRTIYSINKSKVLLGFVGQQWEQHIVAELDSALNKWVDSLPDHLRWDPKRENELFFHQSATLYSLYYQLQIIIHRPFIPSPRKPSPLTFPSLAICTNAARSCSHVIDIQQKRSKVPLPLQIAGAFTSGVVLLLNIWGGKKGGITADPEKEMRDVYKCMTVLKACEPWYHVAGRLWDILYELATVNDLPLPKGSPGGTLKRDRNSESVESSPSPETSTSAPPPGPRVLAGSRRVATARQQRGSQDLPVHSAELARMPLHTAPGAQDAWTPVSPIPPPHSTPMAAFAPSAATTSPIVQGPSSPQQGWMHTEQVAFDQMMNSMLAPGMQTTLGYSMQPPPMTGYNGLGYGAAPVEMYAGMAPQQPGQLAEDTMAMWSSAPAGFEWDDWGSYLNGMSGITNRGGPSMPPHHGH